MSGVESRSRLEQLQALARRTHHEAASAGRRGDRAEHRRLLDLEQRIGDAIVAAGGKRPSTGPGVPRNRRKKAEDRVGKRLLQLGVTSHEVKVWAVSVGLLDAVRRGRIKAAIVEAYATAHTTLEESA
jgi:hypothetical protein